MVGEVDPGQQSAARGAHQVQHGGDVQHGGLGIQQRELQPGRAVDRGAGDHRPARLEQHPSDQRHEAVRRRRIGASGTEAEQHRGQVRRAQHLEVGIGLEQASDVRSQIAHLVHHRAQSIRAQRAQRGPQLQRVEPPRGLQGLVDLVRLGILPDGLGRGVQIVRVPGRGGELRGVAHDERARGDRLEERLVEVDRDRVCALDAVQQVASRGRDQQAAPVGGVHVQPDPVLSAEVRSGMDRVDEPAIGGARRERHRHHGAILGLGLLDRDAEGVGIHPSVLRAVHRDDRVLGQAQQHGGARDREVADGAGQQAQPADGLVPRCGGLPDGVLPGEEQRLQVRLRAARGEHPVAGRESDPLGGPGDQALLDEGGHERLVVGVHRSVDRGEHRLGGDRGQHDRAVQMCGVRGVMEPHGVARVELVGLAQGGAVADPGGVQVDVGDHRLQRATIRADGRGGDAAEALRDGVDHLVQQLRIGLGGRRGQQGRGPVGACTLGGGIAPAARGGERIGRAGTGQGGRHVLRQICHGERAFLRMLRADGDSFRAARRAERTARFLRTSMSEVWLP